MTSPDSSLAAQSTPKPAGSDGPSCAVAAGSGLPWWVVDAHMRRLMAGPYRLEETAAAVRDFMANLRTYENHTLVIGAHADTGNPWLPADQNNPDQIRPEERTQPER